MRLAETIDRIFGRVEVVLAGAEGPLRDGEEALARGDAMGARRQAHTILSRVPGSPLGLALLADACEAGGLDAELALTLQELAERVGSRADFWTRLARAREATGAPTSEVRDAYVRALAVAEPGAPSRNEALLGLADLDLAAGDGARAELWLERVEAGDALLSAGAAGAAGTGTAATNAPLAFRKAEARLLEGDAAGAQLYFDSFENDSTDGRAAFARGRTLAILRDGRAFVQLIRALLLDVPGASEALSSTLAYVPSNEETRARVRAVVEARGESALARWRAAFARAEGRRDEARQALSDAALGGDISAARPLLDAALEDRDAERLALALATLPKDAPVDPEAQDANLLLFAAKEAAESGSVSERLDACAAITHARVRPWARAIRDTIVHLSIPSNDHAQWPALLGRLDTHARALHDLTASSELATLAEQRARPIRLAIVGEFNAGKSTFINALLGADVAPTGVLPTTATLHHLRYAQDPIARIFLTKPTEQERIVPLPELRAVLKAIPEPEAVDRVEILAPLPFLTRIEILDTPGFNAPDARHAEAARRAFSEADVIVWLLDGAQAMKASERAILEEAKRADLPVQFLVNKADRLSPDDLAKVMSLVQTSISGSGLVSWSEPLALSARLALQGRLGDAAALETSRWTFVQNLFDTELVGRADELKERALRRRARRLVLDLAADAEAEARTDEAHAVNEENAAKEQRKIAADLDRDADRWAETLAESLTAAENAWRAELEVVATGKSKRTNEGAAAIEGPLARYRVDRALAHVAPVLSDALAARTAQKTMTRELARDLVRTAASLAPIAETSRAGDRDGDDETKVTAAGTASLWALGLARAAVGALAEHLANAAQTRSSPLKTEARARCEELAAIATELAKPLTGLPPLAKTLA